MVISTNRISSYKWAGSDGIAAVLFPGNTGAGPSIPTTDHGGLAAVDGHSEQVTAGGV